MLNGEKYMTSPKSMIYHPGCFVYSRSIGKNNQKYGVVVSYEEARKKLKDKTELRWLHRTKTWMPVRREDGVYTLFLIKHTCEIHEDEYKEELRSTKILCQ